MGYIRNTYGKRSPEFIEGFISAMDTYAVNRDGKLWIGSPERELNCAKIEAIMELVDSSNCPFRQGDEVEVWDDEEKYAGKRTFITYVPGVEYPYICVNRAYKRNFINGGKFGITPWKHCRPCRHDLKENDPVIVWHEDGSECRRLFAGWTLDGRIKCFQDGLTKWTSEGRTVSWNHWRLPTEEELET